MSTQQKDWISKWLPLIFAIGANVVTIAYGYGQLTQRIEPIERHVAEAAQTSVTRHEFNDLKSRLDRMESKLDRLLERP